MVEVLAKITTQRSQDIALKGFDFGYEIPKQRIHPLIKPRLDSIFFIAEIKRSSPSAGAIGTIESPQKLAGDYLNGGAGAISVLCEERHFGGSLCDLMAVKSAYPNACILRKDFIQYVEEIDISYRAGADMVLLIVAMFIDENEGFSHFKAIYEECLKVGITPLIEVHTQAEIDFIAPLQAPLVGINSRSLHTFEINIPAACALKNALPHSKVIFESGIDSPHCAFVVGSLGFNGLLCGSYLVAHKNPTAALQSLKHAFTLGNTQKPRFYRQVFESLSMRTLQSQPLLKICGITNLDDALMVAQEKIDMLGFILVKQSPRYIESKRIKDIAKALHKLYPHILRIAVVNDDKQSLNEAKTLYEQGYIDAIQLHGLSPLAPDIFAKSALKDALFCFYPVQNITHKEDFTQDYEGVFCLVDSKSAQGGGSGQSINKDVLRALQEQYLCVAGGINPQNIADFLTLKPTLLDINSGIEREAGKKDIHKLRTLLENLKNAIESTKE
ncbi:bifunctional indole-3-glycerol phosphate synthase/phosphoribosylanthranilate isomerase [Helicobacter sp. MIT 21-1697]|uniref:bifunctional indole-3-glycerol phosphate synthase/phosphoribosylanthranilate isomerase n=1 Tax=Helicobacter sp. MIT 21-1697 TaxID=2993733 RepID=UPI00224B2C6A|nr:bifunctional indole-3-glycerol phosphate synthase/phosphoribosylanthranilate isomerase [Helicobacter sp. MIT 21-1697]MCX2716573.1 bifunctional indole-3-glycerol phosphate synthase/phosphoribosylanthranilate isomerase [Helicobacter sp. MIT 21-1697]